jgi:hypothetical protein
MVATAISEWPANSGAEIVPRRCRLPHKAFQMTSNKWRFTMSNFSAAIRNLFSRKLKTSRRVPYRRNPTRPLLELLEGRDVPSVFVPGSIQGQDRWSGGSGAISTQIDQAVDQTGSDAHYGVGALHISNDTNNGNYNGGFGGWVFSPGLSVAAGQPDSLAGADRFSATLYFRSANTVADGSNIEVDLGNPAGNDRTTFLAITNKADGDGGLQLRMAEPNPNDPGNDFFFPTQTVTTNITRGVWHRIDIQAKFIDGPANDTFQVSLDGVAMTNLTPGSPNNGTYNWGTFEGYEAAHGSAYDLTNRLFFRSGAAPSGYGSFSDTGAKGFYIDDVSYKDWNSVNPNTILASYTATFEQAPSTVYVNASWAGDSVGVDPDGAGPATSIGYDAFATIQDGLNAVAAGGTVYVAAGTYAGNVVVNKPVTLVGAEAGINPVPGRSGPETVVEPGLTSSFDSDSVFLVESSNVTIDGFTIQGSIASPAQGQSSSFLLPTGANVYAAAGISNSGNVNTGGSAGSTTDVSDLTVQNNIIQDFTQFGVYGDTSDGTVSTGNYITDNVIKDVPNNGQGGYIGEGVLIYDNFYADVTGNAISNVRTGIQTGNNYLSAGSFAPSVSDNTVSAYVKGIYYNLQYESASGFTIADNTITQADGSVSPAYNVGLLIQSIQSSVQSNIPGNDVSGFLYGVEFAGNNTTNTVAVHGGQLTDNTYGVWATNNDYFYPANFDTAAALDGVTVTNSTNAGIWVDSTSPNSGNVFNTTNTVSLAIGGGTAVTGGAVGLKVSGGLTAITGDTLNDTTFTGQTGLYIDLMQGALHGSTLDATGVTFDGHTGATATLVQDFAIEDKIQDAVDDASLGFVRIKAGNMFVTPVSSNIHVSATEGNAFTGVVATFIDPTGTLAAGNSIATITWGDHDGGGNPLTSLGAIVDLGGGHFQVTGSHTYAEEGNYAVSVAITDHSAYLNGFETPSSANDWTDYATGTSGAGITLTTSGSGLLPSAPASGSSFAVVQNTPDSYLPGYGGGGYTHFGGAQNTYTGPFQQSVSIYINTDWAAPTNPSVPAFWLDETPYHQDPSNYGAEHNFRFWVDGLGAIKVTADNAGESSAFATITSSGWYTFQMVYYKADNPSDPALTDLSVFDETNTLIGSKTGLQATSPGGPLASSDLMGHGYAWLTAWQNGFANNQLAIDNLNTSVLPISASATANVADAALSAAVGVNIAPTEAAAFSGVVATFTDPAGSEAVSDYSATISWGDQDAGGNPITSSGTIVDLGGGNFQVVGSHTYAEEGSYALSVSISHDALDAVLATSSTATVADAALTTKSFSPPAATEGAPFSGTVLNFSDADPNATAADYTAVVTLGNGDTVTLTSTASADGQIVAHGDGTFDVNLSYTYTEELSGQTFSVVVTDHSNQASGSTNSFSVADAALSAGQLTPPSATEGVSTGNMVLFHFTDANPSATAADYTAVVNWGDGASDSSAAANPVVAVVANPNGGFDVVGSHTYAKYGSGLTFSVTVQDAGGAEPISASALVNVTGAPVDVAGTVIFDANQNNSADPGEGGVAGLVVFADANNNGILDAGELSAVTDAQGRYVLQGMTDGDTYTIRLAGRSDFALTGPTQVVVTALADQAGPTFTGVPFLNSAPIFVSMEATPSDTNGNRAFVLGLYHDLLGRDGSGDAGVNGWVSVLNSGGSRSDVVSGVVNSLEYRGRQVDHFYQAFLGRQADEAGRAAWINYLQHGGTEEQMAAMFLSSAEYQAKFHDNAGFVRSLYDCLLFRGVSDAEAAGWVDALNAGASRADVVRGFLHSQEASLRAVDSVYAGFLRREADPTGREGFADFLQRADSKAMDVMVAILASNEYRGRFPG